MNILPDYLITYMPEIEEALEELRLSVIDHAYELLQRLDVDELSTDEVRQKLELYDIRVDNMSGDWLPNGRFYRLYPSIKHHRSRHNAIKAIAKSGGQFEGLWSTEFSNKSEYNFKDITVARHYELQNNADGYFFVNGNTEKTARGTVVSSAAQALTTDVLINQALPAGYTYLYIPWPRPVYPGDSSYFYNVHMLDYDRLCYADACEHKWFCVDKENGIYYCPENSMANQYCKVSKDRVLYRIIQNGVFTDDYANNFDRTAANTDVPYFNDLPIVSKKPASERYDWEFGTNTPYKTPYWFDYHYMETMKKELPYEGFYGTWPIHEHGVYRNEDGGETDPDKAVTYDLDPECAILGSTQAVFPTKCYLKSRYKTTEPNREQKFSLGSPVITIYSVIDEDVDELATILSEALSKDREYMLSLLNSTLEYEYRTEDDSKRYIVLDGDVSKEEFVYLKVGYIFNGEIYRSIVPFHNGKYEADLLADSLENLVVYSPAQFVTNGTGVELFETSGYIQNLPSNHCHYKIDCSHIDSIDTNNCVEIEHISLNEKDADGNLLTAGAYRNDLLHSGAVLKLREILGHTKTYSPVWNTSTLFYSMMQAYTNEAPSENSLYYWMNLKQSENKPAISNMFGDPSSYYDSASVLEHNKPNASEITFTSYDMPVRGKLDPVYIGYLSDDVHEQEVNQPFFGDNSVYTFDLDPDDEKVRAKMITYDPEYYYTAISLGYCVDDEQEHKINHIKDSMYSNIDVYAQPIGNPYTKEFSIRCVENSNHNYTGRGNIPMYNYITFKKSLVHKLWFDSKHKDVPFKYEQIMYNMCGSQNVYKYTENRVHIEYNVLGVYTEKGVKLEGVYCELHCIVSDNAYIIYCRQPNFNPGEGATHASYVLFTVKVTAGSCRELEYASVEHSAQYHLGTSVHKSTDIGEFDYDE